MNNTIDFIEKNKKLTQKTPKNNNNRYEYN